MKSTEIYSDLFSSILKFCSDILPVIGAGDATVVNFDEYADDESLPDGDLLGPAQYSLHIDEHVATVSLMIGVATQDDLNLFRLNALIGKLFNYLLPGKTMWAVSATTGERLGNLVVANGSQVFPVIADSVRPMKFIGIRLISDVTFAL